MFWIILSYLHKSAKMTSLLSVFQQWTSGPNCTTITSVMHVAYPNRKNATDMEGPMMWSSLTMEYEEHLQLLLLKLIIWWKEVLHNGTQTFHTTTESLSAIVISYLKRWDLKTIPSDVNVSVLFSFVILVSHFQFSQLSCKMWDTALLGQLERKRETKLSWRGQFHTLPTLTPSVYWVAHILNMEVMRNISTSPRN